jgi:TAT-translocated FGD2 family F420-dependent dehydrogenase
VRAPLLGFHGGHEQFTPGELVELAVAAEAAGFEALTLSDHLHPWQDNQGHAGHAWITLAAIGQRTSTLRLGTSVTAPIYRYHPVEVAHAFASLAVLYPGRIFLGAGTGEALNEAPYGGWGPYRERAARLSEAIGIIRRLWSGGWVEHAGRHFTVRGVRLYDAPPGPPPIYVAASGPRSARIAGRAGDGWITDPRTARERDDVRQAFEDGAREAGKDPAALERIVELWCVVGGRDEALAAAPLWQFLPVFSDVVDIAGPHEVQRIAEERSSPERTVDGWLVSPDPAVHVEAVRQLARRGATQVFVHSPQPDQRRVIEFYGREVIPALRAD